ncbi:hypothetical protein QZH41_008779 [Actinostola sp. cb2023]|nr:hypothetical protein QZH41_008779 [Actinostola sp. cb2023]
MAEPSLLLDDREMADVLRQWNDEEDEVVEFIQHSPPEGTRQRTENGSLHDELPSERKTNPRERSTLTGKPFYTPYIRCMKAFCLFVSFVGLVPGNAILFVLRPNKSQSYMQFLHFSFAAGAFLAPLLARPFLLPDNITNPTSNETVEFNPDDIPQVTWAYWLGTTPCVMAGVFFLACAFLKALKEDTVKKEEHHLHGSYANNRLYKGIVLLLFCVLLLNYVGMEIVYGGFIFAFAVKSKPHMSNNHASLLTATYWGTFALARLISVPISKHVKPQKMLLIDIIGCLIAGVILVSQSHDGCDVYSSPKLWAGTVILGISAASFFAAALSWVEYFLDVSGRVASILLVGACVGDMIVPVVVGNTFKSIGPCTLMYCVFTLSCLCLLNFAAIHFFSRHIQSSSTLTGIQFHKKNKTMEEPPKPKEQDEDEVLKLLEQNNEKFNGN